MPGINSLYISFADSHVQLCLNKGKLEQISRAKVEFQLLNELDKAEFPIQYKLSWYHNLLASSDYDAYWLSVSKLYNLPESCTTRYVPDLTLLEYEAPTAGEDEVEEDGEDDHIGGAADGDVEEVTPRVESHDDTPKEIHDEQLHEDVSEAAATTASSTIPSTPASVVAGDDNARESSPDSLDSTSSAGPDPLGPLCDEDEEEEPDPASLDPLFHVRVERHIPNCERCKSSGHYSRLCPVAHQEPVSIDDWQSIDSDEYPAGQDDKNLARRFFLAEYLRGAAAAPATGQDIDDWLETVVMDRESFYHAMGLETPPPSRPTADDDDEADEATSPIDTTTAVEAKATSPPSPPQQVSLKLAAKPHGVLKSKPSPKHKKKKQPTPAQLLTQAAKTRPVPVKRGTKRELEDDDEQEGPVVKRAKVGE